MCADETTLSGSLGPNVFQFEYELNPQESQSQVIVSGGQNSDFRFILQAVCVPFLLAYILHRRGIKVVFSKVGREPTGDPLDADPKWMEIERRQVPFNPVINAGAILMASMLAEERAEKRCKKFRDFVRKACKNDDISVDKGVFRSETEFGKKTGCSPGSRIGRCAPPKFCR